MLTRSNLAGGNIARQKARFWRSRVEALRARLSADYPEIEPVELLSDLLHVIALRRLELIAPEVLAGKGRKSDLVRCASELHERVLRCEPGFDYALPAPACQARLSLIGRELNDVSDEVFACATILGDTYQLWCSMERKVALASIQSANKELNKQHLTSFTQIYTPGWVVDFLAVNAILPQVDGGLLENEIPDDLAGMLAPGENRGASGVKSPEGLTVLDPAMGCGHLLVGALAMIFRLLPGRSADEKSDLAAEIINDNLAGADIDVQALSIYSLAMRVEAFGYGIERDLRFSRIELVDTGKTDMLGSLAETGGCLGGVYDVVLTNPPYIGRKLIDRELKQRLKERYPEACGDLSAAFVRRCLDFLRPGGVCGVITQASILTLPTYERLRRYMLDHITLTAAVDAGPGVFPTQSGEKINSALLVMRNGKTTENEQICFIDIRTKKDKQAALEQALNASGANAASGGPRIYNMAVSTIRSQPRLPFNYELPGELVGLLTRGKPLAELAELRQGLATTDNSRFLRYRWQVPVEQIGKKWFPYVKGAGSERWFSPTNHVVDWERNGERIKESVRNKYPYLKDKVSWVVKNEFFYFRPGLVFSFVNSGGLAVRKLASGCIFDVGASAIFSKDSGVDENFILGYLNSSLMVALIRSINPTINYQVGDLKRVPMLLDESAPWIAKAAVNCHDARKEIYRLKDPVSMIVLDEEEPDVFNGLAACQTAEQTRAAIRQAHRLYMASVETIAGRLIVEEERINQLVLESFSKRFRWSKSQLRTVERFIETAGRSRFHPGDTDETDFLYNLLVRDLISASRKHGRPQLLLGTDRRSLSPEAVEILKIHSSSSPGGFLAGLGPYLKRVFHGQTPSGISVILEEFKRR